MTCERYWREGVVLYERGEIDPHRESCVDCQQAHAACAQMIEALPHVGDDIVGDPLWQTKVLERIEQGAEVIDIGVARRADKPKRPPPSSRSSWWRRSGWLTGAFAGACAIVCVWLLVGRKPELDEVHYGISKTESTVTRRSATRAGEPKEDSGSLKRSATMDDAVTITARPTEVVLVYRADKLILHCPTDNQQCSGDARSVVAHVVFGTAGDYQILVIKPPPGAPPFTREFGTLDSDLSAAVTAGADYEETDYSVR